MMKSTTSDAGAPRKDPVSLPAMLASGKKVTPDAISLLIQDHREVEGLFEAYEELDETAAKMRLARRICIDLKAHMQIEEELFYPIVRAAIEDGELIDHAEEEHAEAKRLIGEIEASEPTGAAFDDLLRELRLAVEEHVEEEEAKLLPAARASDLDIYDLGRRLAAHRQAGFARLTGRPLPVVPDEAAA